MEEGAEVPNDSDAEVVYDIVGDIIWVTDLQPPTVH
jgi:hypothetical protein